MNPNTSDHDHDPLLGRVDALHRQQLSALIDGELSADQARFLIRRLEHDQELSACQERWQMAGDVLRGQLGAVAPADFAARVALALPPVALSAPEARPVAGSQRWVAGGALAAGLALVAVLLLPGSPPADVPAARLAAQPAAMPAAVEVSAPASVPAPAPGLASAPVTPSVSSPSPDTALAAAGSARPAVASAPAPAPGRQSRPAPTAQQPALVAVEPPHAASPFALPATPGQIRPWPRSQLSQPEAFNVSLPGAASPFAPPRDAAVSSHWRPAPQP